MQYIGRICILLCLSAADLLGQEQAGNEEFEKGNYAAAAAAYERAVSAPGALSQSVLYNRLAISYHMLARFKDAEAAYKSATRLGEKSSAASNNFGALFFSQRKFREAEREFRNALEQDPENGVMRRNLRAAKYARENGRKIRPTADTISKDKPLLVDRQQNDLIQVVLLVPPEELERATLHERRGDSFLARKLYEDAVIEYRKAVAIDPYNPSAINRLGIAYHQSQRLPEAERQYRAVLRVNPYYLEALNNLGSIDYVRKRYNRAMDYYEKALEIRPNSPTILQNIGSCLFAMERFEDGMKIYQRALELDPKLFEHVSSFGTLIQTPHRNEPMINFYLAKVFAAAGDKERAISYLYKAVEEGFKDVEKLKAEPAFAILADDERFAKLLASLTTAS